MDVSCEADGGRTSADCRARRSGSVVLAAVSAYLIADGIPVFDGSVHSPLWHLLKPDRYLFRLISLVGALFGASIGLVTMGS